MSSQHGEVDALTQTIEAQKKELAQAYTEIDRLKSKINTLCAYFQINLTLAAKFAEGNSEK